MVKLTLLAALTTAALLSGCHDEPLDVAPALDLKRFQGKWFEIAKLPRATQTDCTSTTAFYTLKSDTELDVVNECLVGGPTGTRRTVSAEGRVVDPATPAKLSVNFGGFFGDFWVIDVGEHYEYTVVGHPSRQYLWILSRTATLDAPTLAGILDRASAKKFDTSRLQYTSQQP